MTNRPSTSSFEADEIDVGTSKEVRLQVAVCVRAIHGDRAIVEEAETITAEILDNLFEHAKPASGGRGVSVKVTVSNSMHGVELKFIDNGESFNPLEAEIPSPSAGNVGGLGLMIVRSMASNLSFERGDDGRNILTVILKLGEE